MVGGMRFGICVWVAAAACLGQAAACWAETAFFIGNSFTANCEPDGLPALAATAGKDLTTGWQIKHGSPIHNIWGSPSSYNSINGAFGAFSSALPGNQWDAVTFQPFYKPDYQGFPPATMATDISSILSFISLTRQNPANASTKFYIYQSWPFVWLGKPFQQAWDTTTADDLSSWSYHTRDYYEHLIHRVRAQTDAEVYMIPIPEVLYQLDRKMQAGEIPGFTSVNDLLSDDSLHLDAGLGHYLAGATVYATIFGEAPSGLTKPAGHYDGDGPFTPAVYDAFHDTVWDVVSTHEYTGVPEPGTVSLSALGALAVLRRRRRR